MPSLEYWNIAPITGSSSLSSFLKTFLKNSFELKDDQQSE